MSQLDKETISKMSAEHRRIAKALLASQVRWDLVKFFHANPFTIHTAQGLASMIGRRLDTVETETEALVGVRVLRRLPANGGPALIYAYDPEPDVRIVIGQVESVSSSPADLAERLLGLFTEADSR
ncbi:MAG: hypothetical protein M1335_05430 [Chloroflexi bacterium]|nr:hypothetical protein [Chloroflexota bacterium]